MIDPNNKGENHGDGDNDEEQTLSDAEILTEASKEYKNELNSKIAFSSFKTLYPNSIFVTYEDILQLNCSGTFNNSAAQVKAQGYVHALDIVQLENLPVITQTYDAYLADATNGSNDFKILTKILEIHLEFTMQLSTKFQACDLWSKKARVDVPGDTPTELPPSKD